jgi:N-acetylmuramic acid 6-phosphate etherase
MNTTRDRLTNTEKPTYAHGDLDRYATLDLVLALVSDQRNAVSAVISASQEIAKAVDAALPRIRAGGRLVYVGAGTSGRLGLLDSVELNPTFSWPVERARALLAGGNSAVYQAVEGAEDDRAQGAQDVLNERVDENDVVICIAASGSTPYVLGAISMAKSRGALVLGFANNPNAAITREADIGITLDTGSEIISGSTRLKAGTSQKIALNTFSSALMVKLNKVYGNLMVDVKPTNAKLIRRCINLTMLATGVSEAEAISALEACDFHVKRSIVVLLGRVTAERATSLIDAFDGNVRDALANISDSEANH